MTAHSIAERSETSFVCLCGEIVPVASPTGHLRAFWGHVRINGWGDPEGES